MIADSSFVVVAYLPLSRRPPLWVKGGGQGGGCGGGGTRWSVLKSRAHPCGSFQLNCHVTL